MADRATLEAQVRNLLRLDETALEQELVRAVSIDEDLLATLRLPMTSPPQSASAIFASMTFAERIQLVRSALEDGLEKNRKRLYDLVCVKLKYCEQKGAGEIRLLGSILAGLMAKGIILIAYPKLWVLPAAIVYLHKNGFFDKLCKCSKKQ